MFPKQHYKQWYCNHYFLEHDLKKWHFSAFSQKFHQQNYNNDNFYTIILDISSTTSKTMRFCYIIFQDFSPTASQNSGRSVICHNSPVRATAVGFPPDNCFWDRTAERSSRSRSVGTNRQSLRRKRADQSLQVKRQ